MKIKLSILLAPKLLSPSLLAPKFYFRIVPTILLSLCGFLTLSACQKTQEPEKDTQVETKAQGTPIMTRIDNNNEMTEVAVIDVQNTDDNSAETERDISLSQPEDNIGATGVILNAETNTPSPEQLIKGTQITDVRYRSAAGATLSVVFETSAARILNAIVTLPNKPKMTLSAQEGQGNNPTYRSTDGNIELISHGGGSTIDLMQNNKVTSFDAISVEAEVVTQP